MTDLELENQANATLDGKAKEEIQNVIKITEKNKQSLA